MLPAALTAWGQALQPAVRQRHHGEGYAVLHADAAVGVALAREPRLGADEEQERAQKDNWAQELPEQAHAQ